jgi:gliding motility-associated lipoprotein GldH
MNFVKQLLYCLVCCSLFLTACQTIDLYEKTATIPGHKWKSSFKPSFSFTIKDTSSPYQLFITLRHKDRYNYNNIYINLTTLQPGQDSTQSERYDLKLGSDDTGWLGSGMDDIYEHRIPLTPANLPFYFKKPGDYTFTIEQVMREDPLENVLNVGLRIEKKQP